MDRANGVFAGLEGIRMATSVYTGIIEKEGTIYVALCPELDVASQGSTVGENQGIRTGRESDGQLAGSGRAVSRVC